MDYAQVEEQFKTLKEQFTAGKLDEAAFKAKLNELMVQDGQGHWWMIGYETGQWYTHDGTTWVRADPPGRAAPTPTQQPKASALAAPAMPDQAVKQNAAQPAAPLATPAVKTPPERPEPANAVKKMGWGFWLRWIGSLAVGMVVLVLLFGIDSAWSSASRWCLITGGVIGILQWLIMRQYIDNSWWWILANPILAWLLGSVAAASYSDSLGSYLLFGYLIADLIAGPLLVARGRRLGAGV